MPTCTVIYEAGAPFSTITWENSPIVEAAGIINRQRTRDFLKIAADRRCKICCLICKLFDRYTYLFSAEETCHRFIGVNNRNFHSFPVDMGTTSSSRLVGKVKDIILCFEWYIHSADVQPYISQGVRTVLCRSPHA